MKNSDDRERRKTRRIRKSRTLRRAAVAARGHEAVPCRRSPDRVTEMLKLCLQKVCELQAELQQNEEGAPLDDPEAAGYAACAMETLRFLSSQGLEPDDPVFRTLAERLMLPD